MVWLRRVSFFMMVNIGIVLMLSFILNLLGLGQNLGQGGGSALFLFCLFWGTGGAFISLWISKWMAKRAYGVQLINSNTADIGWIVTATHQMARRAKLEAMPEVGVYESSDINAFATGPSKNSAMVAVSTGLLEKMQRDEVEGVLGHEVAHIANGDMVTMTLLQGIMNAFVMFFARIAAQFIDSLVRSDDEEGGLGFWGYLAAVMFFEFVFGLIGLLVTSYFSRIREYRADEGSVKLVGKNKMIAALERLKGDYSTIEADQQRDRAVAAFQISSKSKMLEWLSTHPPLESRLNHLKRM